MVNCHWKQVLIIRSSLFHFSHQSAEVIPERDSKLLACLDERIEHCRVAYSFNASEEHASVSLQDNGPYRPFRYRVVYTVFTVIPVSENLFSEGSQIIEGSQHKITVHFIPVRQKFIEPGSYRFHDFCCRIMVPSLVYLLRG